MTSDRTAIVYLHGFPGGPAEISLFASAPGWAPSAFLPDRAADRPELPADAYFDDLAARALVFAAGRPLHLIGFSLGARVALEIAARQPAGVAGIDLISPAGPLDGTDHLRLMAGAKVFGMAAARPGLFGLQTAMQGWIARNRPALLYRALFGAAGEAGLDDPEFAPRATALLQHCFRQGNAGYRREVLAYVAAWSDLPARVVAPVTIWQGGADGWTPPPMAENLRSLLPAARLQPVPGKGHYGTLRHALAHVTPFSPST